MAVAIAVSSAVVVLIMTVATAAVTYSGTVGQLLRDHADYADYRPSGPETTLL